MRIRQIGIMAIMLVSAAFFLAGCSGNSQTMPTGRAVAGINDNPDKVAIYFFWGDGCPHCMYQKPFLEELQQKYPEIELKMFETWHNPENGRLFSDMAKAYGTNAQGVPTTFIADKFWVGYAEYMGKEMEDKIRYCIENSCINPGDKLS